MKPKVFDLWSEILECLFVNSKYKVNVFARPCKDKIPISYNSNYSNNSVEVVVVIITLVVVIEMAVVVV